jgi:hypothetical protein
VPGLQLSATSLSPSPLNARRDLPALYTNGCHRNFEDTDTAGCVFGDRASGTSVVLFGDSHAASWFPALERLAKSNGWRLIALTKSGCPAKDIEPYNPNHKRAYEECTTWRGKVFERIAKERPAAVITASINAYAVSVGGSTLSPSDGADAETEGWVRTVDVLLQSTPSVILVRDTPEMGRDEASCVSEHRRDLAQCSAARSGALAPNLSDVRAAFALASRPGFRYVDLSDSICLPTVCPAVADDILLYRDANHLTATFSRSLADALESQLPPLG